MKKNWIAACMTAVCALALVTGCSSETDEPDGIEYDAGEWLIEGTTVRLYRGTGTDVQVPDGVTEIGKRAFASRTKVAHVTLPDSVAVIEDYAFSGCTGLADVNLPESVAMIGWYAFSGCESLTEVTIPAKVTSIGEYAFWNCTNLADVQIPGSVEAIGDDAFRGCESLETVTIPDGVKTIGYNAFANCSGLKSVTIPASVTEIGNYAFDECESLDTVTYQGTLAQWCALDGGYNLMSSAARVTIAGEDKELQSMTELVIPGGVETIGSGAFRGCGNLTSVTIPVSVESIGYDAFYCYNLANVTYGGTQEQWDEIEKSSQIFYSSNNTITGKDGVTFTVDRYCNIIESE